MRKPRTTADSEPSSRGATEVPRPDLHAIACLLLKETRIPAPEVAKVFGFDGVAAFERWLERQSEAVPRPGSGGAPEPGLARRSLRRALLGALGDSEAELLLRTLREALEAREAGDEG